MCEWGDTETVMVGDKPVDVDRCIVPLVLALDAAGLRPAASCCGHGKQPTTIILDDDRFVMVLDRETAMSVCQQFPPIND